MFYISSSSLFIFFAYYLAAVNTAAPGQPRVGAVEEDVHKCRMTTAAAAAAPGAVVPVVVVAVGGPRHVDLANRNPGPAHPSPVAHLSENRSFFNFFLSVFRPKISGRGGAADVVSTTTTTMDSIK
jgi:hypothetical protein